MNDPEQSSKQGGKGILVLIRASARGATTMNLKRVNRHGGKGTARRKGDRSISRGHGGKGTGQFLEHGGKGTGQFLECPKFELQSDSPQLAGPNEG
jgi:hypothetical protein